MNTVKVFLASSGTLKEERDEIEKFISRKNDSLITHGLYLKTVIWEKHSSRFSNLRKQEEFNKLVDDSDVFICLIYDNVGQFTLEEFERAYNGFTKNSRPKYFFVYFKDTPLKPSEIIDLDSVLKLQERIKLIEQIWSTFESVAELVFAIDRELNLVIEDNKKNNAKSEHSTYEVEFANTIIDILDTNAHIVKMTKFHLLRAIEPFQFIYDSVSVDGKVDIDTIYVDKGISRKINQQINYVDVVTDLGYIVKQGERITKTFTCNLIDSFTNINEVWEDDNVNKVGFLKTSIIFPNGRKYKSFNTKILRGFREIEINKAREIFINGRFAIDIEMENEQIFDKIRTNWEW